MTQEFDNEVYRDEAEVPEGFQIEQPGEASEESDLSDAVPVVGHSFLQNGRTPAEIHHGELDPDLPLVAQADRVTLLFETSFLGGAKIAFTNKEEKKYGVPIIPELQMDPEISSVVFNIFAREGLVSLEHLLSFVEVEGDSRLENLREHYETAVRDQAGEQSSELWQQVCQTLTGELPWSDRRLEAALEHVEQLSDAQRDEIVQQGALSSFRCAHEALISTGASEEELTEHWNSFVEEQGHAVGSVSAVELTELFEKYQERSGDVIFVTGFEYASSSYEGGTLGQSIAFVYAIVREGAEATVITVAEGRESEIGAGMDRLMNNLKKK